MSTGGDSTSPLSSTSRMTSPPENGSPQQEDVARPLMRVVEQQKKKMTIQRTKPNREHILDADPGNRSLRAPPIRQSWPATQAETVAATTLGTHLTSIVSTESVQSDPGGNRHPASTYKRTNPPPTKKKNMEDDNMAPDHIPPIPVGRKRNSVVSLGNDSLGDPPSRESRTTASNHVTGKLPVPQQQPQQQRTPSSSSSSSSSSATTSSEELLLLSELLNEVDPAPPLLSANQRKFESSGDITQVIPPNRRSDTNAAEEDPMNPTNHHHQEVVPNTKMTSLKETGEDGEECDPPPLLDMRRFESLGDDTVVPPNRHTTTNTNHQPNNVDSNEKKEQVVVVGPKRQLMPTTSDGGHLYTVSAPVRIESKIVYPPNGGGTAAAYNMSKRDSDITILDQSHISDENDQTTLRKGRLLTPLEEHQYPQHGTIHSREDNDDDDDGIWNMEEEDGNTSGRNLGRTTTLKTSNLTKTRLLAKIDLETTTDDADSTEKVGCIGCDDDDDDQDDFYLEQTQVKTARASELVDIEYVPRVNAPLPSQEKGSTQQQQQQQQQKKGGGKRSSTTSQVSNVIIDALLMDKTTTTTTTTTSTNNENNDVDASSSSPENTTEEGAQKQQNTKINIPASFQKPEGVGNTLAVQQQTQEQEKTHLPLPSQGRTSDISHNSDASAKDDTTDKQTCLLKKIAEAPKVFKGGKAKVATDGKKQQKKQQKGKDSAKAPSKKQQQKQQQQQGKDSSKPPPKKQPKPPKGRDSPKCPPPLDGKKPPKKGRRFSNSQQQQQQQQQHPLPIIHQEEGEPHEEKKNRRKTIFGFLRHSK